MKRLFVGLAALAIILSLPCTLLVAQDKEEEPREHAEHMRSRNAKAHHSEEREREEHQRDMEHQGREEGHDERPCWGLERLYDRLFEELERQRHEIRALREEVAELLRMLEEQSAPARSRRGRRWEREPRPFRERSEMERRHTRREPDIDMEIRELQEAVERHPDNVDLRMKLGHLYREIGRVEDAIGQYKAALEIRPDFDAPHRALKELGYRFPDRRREEEERLEDSAGVVISSNEKEVVVKTREGDTVTFRVPSWQKDDGSWVLNEDLSELAKSLEPDQKVKILWREREEQRFIHRMERIEE